MKRIFPLLLALLTACSNPSSPEHPSTYVSTLVGTLSDYSFSTGNTYPAIAVPWGMKSPTPNTEYGVWALGAPVCACRRAPARPRRAMTRNAILTVFLSDILIRN